MIRYFIGIDNGVSGSVGIIPTEGRAAWFKMPARKELSYTKAKQFITRIDIPSLAEAFNAVVPLDADIVCKVERPLTRVKWFKSVVSGMRALEAVQIFLEGRKVSYSFIDSREWQRVILPSGLKGTDEMKDASDDICHRLFPHINVFKGGGGDSLLIAKYLHDRQN